MIDPNKEWAVSVKRVSWSLIAPPGWVRTRENSLTLDDLELWLVWKGRGRMNTLREEFDLMPGLCILMRPGSIYDAVQDEENPLGLTFIHFDFLEKEKGTFRKVGVERMRQFPEFFSISDLAYVNGALQRVVRLIRTNLPLANILFKAVFQDVLESYSIPSAQEIGFDERRAAFEKLVAEIQYGALQGYRVSDLARRMAMSPAHFSRTFREFMGMSPQRFLLENRIFRARYLLRETDHTLERIAEELSYSDLFFFCKQFKEKVGLSPGAYRKQTRANRSE